MRVTPMLSMVRFIATATAGIPAADFLGCPTSTCFSSMSASGDLRRKAMSHEYPHSPTAIKERGHRHRSQLTSGITCSP